MERNNDYIEMIDKTDNNKIHMTKEENRKIKPKELHKINLIFKSQSNIAKYSWESDGEKVNISYLFMFRF